MLKPSEHMMATAKYVVHAISSADPDDPEVETAALSIVGELASARLDGLYLAIRAVCPHCAQEEKVYQGLHHKDSNNLITRCHATVIHQLVQALKEGAMVQDMDLESKAVPSN